MIGIATKFAALDTLKVRLSASADPKLVALSQLIDAHPGYAYFGALGTSYGDFLPVKAPPASASVSPGPNAYVQIWKLVFNVFGGDGSSANPGLKPVLDAIRDLLGRLDKIAANEDLDALKAMENQVNTSHLSTGFSKGDTVTSLVLTSSAGISIGATVSGTGVPPGVTVTIVNTKTHTVVVTSFTATAASAGKYTFTSNAASTLKQIATDLGTIIATITDTSDGSVVSAVADLITDASRPAITRPHDGTFGFPPRFWTLREFLSWRRTGQFAHMLWEKAAASGKDEFRAYALGWLSSWSLSACGGSAVASIIGAPYRNQWWRARFVSNYIDLWSYGYAEMGLEPAPYDGWPNLCNQELQKRIEIPGAAFDPDDLMNSLREGSGLSTALPGDFTRFWNDCYDAVYGDMGTDRPQVDAVSLQDAYAMAWLVLWFQTSAESLGCSAVMPTAPANCGTAPSWATNPPTPGDAGSGGDVLPLPHIDPKLDPASVICAILLAMLGVVEACTGGFVAGAGPIAGTILVAQTANIDWDKFRCDLAWYHLYLYNALRALHDVLSLAGLVHPYTIELSQDPTTSTLLNLSFPTGDNIVKSKQQERYPIAPWSGINGSWISYPPEAIEQPATVPALSSAYASGFIDDPANPLGSQSPFQSSSWPFQADISGRPLGFMNATDALLAWLPSPNKKLPDWNLDGDRGLGFRTWQFVDDTWTNPVDIEVES